MSIPIDNIDHQIRRLVIELNNAGFVTVESCAGHNGGKPQIAIALDSVDVQIIKTGGKHILWLMAKQRG